VHHSQAAAFRAPQYVGHMVFIAPDCLAQIIHEIAAEAEIAARGTADSTPAAGKLGRPEETLAALYQTVRPYGGTLHLLTSSTRCGFVTVVYVYAEHLSALVDALRLEKTKVELRDYAVCLSHVDALPDPSVWTHKYGYITNTLKTNQ